MKPFLKSRFFWTKIVPTVFFSILVAGALYPFSSILSAFGIICLLSLPVLWMNLHLKKTWISCIAGAIALLISVYLIFALSSEYSEFANQNSHEAMMLLPAGLAICCSSVLMSILLLIHLKRRHLEIS